MYISVSGSKKITLTIAARHKNPQYVGIYYICYLESYVIFLIDVETKIEGTPTTATAR